MTLFVVKEELKNPQTQIVAIKDHEAQRISIYLGLYRDLAKR